MTLSVSKRWLTLVILTCLHSCCRSNSEKSSLPAGIERLHPLTLDLGFLEKKKINLRVTNRFINFTAGRPPSNCLTMRNFDNRVKIVFDSGSDNRSCHMLWAWTQKHFFVRVNVDESNNYDGYRIHITNDIGFSIGPNGVRADYLNDTIEMCRVPNIDSYMIKFSSELGENNTCNYYMITFKENVEYMPESDMLLLIPIVIALFCLIISCVGLFTYCLRKSSHVIASEKKVTEPTTKTT